MFKNETDRDIAESDWQEYASEFGPFPEQGVDDEDLPECIVEGCGRPADIEELNWSGVCEYHLYAPMVARK